MSVLSAELRGAALSLRTAPTIEIEGAEIEGKRLIHMSNELACNYATLFERAAEEIETPAVKQGKI